MRRARLILVTAVIVAAACTPFTTVIVSHTVPADAGDEGVVPADAADAADTGVDEADSAPARHRRVFVTSKGYTGALGGPTGGDAKCRLAALDAGLDGGFAAYLATTATSAVERLSSRGPYYRLDGEMVFDGGPELVAIVPIAVDEFARLLDASTDSVDVWTGESPGLDSNCSNWTTQNGSASWGHADSLSEWQTVLDSSLSCNAESRLYCFEQP
jgi:hypothetical protein